MKRAIVTLASICSLIATSTPAQAIPLEKAVLDIWWLETADPLVYLVGAFAYDPDGRVHHLQVCVDGECATKDSDAENDFSTCIEGDSAEVVLEHKFSEPGTYEITAQAIGGGCLGILPPEASNTSANMSTFEEPPPRDPIPCIGDGPRDASDIGVNADAVRLVAEHEMSGSPSYGFFDGAEAAARAINASGGVCGRRLELTLHDNAYGDGSQAVRERLDDDYFALVGLAIDLDDVAAEISSSGMPAIGTAARSTTELNTPGIYPIGSSPRTQGQVIVDDNFDAGASTFIVVFDSLDPVATETADSIESAVQSVPGRSVNLHPIRGGQASYSAEIQSFNNKCASYECDSVTYLLNEGSFRTWIAGRPSSADVQTNLWPKLMRESTPRNCGTPCNGMIIWSGFELPTSSGGPAASAYANDLRAVSPVADVTDQEAEFGYASVMLSAIAMGRAGPELTREGVKTVLDSEAVNLGLNGGALVWSPSRDANHWLRGYRIVTAQGSFAGFTEHGGWRSND